MPRKTRLTSYLLLLLFGFLFLKNLLPEVDDHSQDNHYEINHIHFYQVYSKVSKSLDVTLEDKTSRPHAFDDRFCPSGKSIFAYSHFPSELYEIVSPNFILAFDLVFKIDNNSLTPYLEPRRKPPRFA